MATNPIKDKVIQLRPAPKFQLPEVKWEKIKAAFFKRCDLAAHAFRKVRARAKAPAPAALLDTQKSVVGWVYPVGEKSFDRFELVPGLNYLIESEEGTKIIQEEPSHGKEGVKIQVSDSRLEVKFPEGPQVFYHGDEAMLKDRKFKVKILSPKTFAKFLTVLLFLHSAAASLLMAEDKPVDKPINVVQPEMVRVQARSGFEVFFEIPGVSRLDESRLKASVDLGGKKISLGSVDASREDTHLIFLVDTSSLCSHRQMEDPINREIQEMVAKSASSNLVSLGEFYRQDTGSEVYTTLFSEMRADSLRDRAKYINCRSEARSVNGVHAIAALKNELIRGPRVKNKRNVVVLFSSGNLKESPETAQLVKKYNLQLIVVVYVRTQTEYVNDVLPPLLEANKGKLYLWSQNEPFRLSEKFPYRWIFKMNAAFPLEAAERVYPLQIQAGDSLVLNANLQYFKNDRSILLYRIKVAFFILLGLLALAALIYFTIRYYRTPVCQKHRVPVSRSWNECLYCAKGKHAMLLISDEDGYQKTHVIQTRETKIGSRLGNDVKIKSPLLKSHLKLKQVGQDIFELGSERDERFTVNGKTVTKPIFLRSGDLIEVAPYEIEFQYEKVAGGQS